MASASQLGLDTETLNSACRILRESHFLPFIVACWTKKVVTKCVQLLNIAPVKCTYLAAIWERGMNCLLIALNLCGQKDTMIFRQKLSLPWTVSGWSLRPAGLYTTGYYLSNKSLAHHLKGYCLLWQRGPLFGCIGNVWWVHDLCLL